MSIKTPTYKVKYFREIMFPGRGGATRAAKKHGVEPATWSYYENTEGELNHETLKKIAKTLNIPFAELTDARNIHDKKSPPAKIGGGQEDGGIIGSVFRVMAALADFGLKLQAGKSVKDIPELPELRGVVQSLEAQLARFAQIDEAQKQVDRPA